MPPCPGFGRAGCCSKKVASGVPSEFQVAIRVFVKIDGAFVQNLKRSDDDRVFVHTLIDLARRLGLETVAEWVQDEVAAAMLADWGCDYLQGALVGLASAKRPWAHAPGGAKASA